MRPGIGVNSAMTTSQPPAIVSVTTLKEYMIVTLNLLMTKWIKAIEVHTAFKERSPYTKKHTIKMIEKYFKLRHDV